MNTHRLLKTLTLALAVALTLGCATTRAPNTQMSDAAITAKIKSRITADPELNPFEIDVDTQNRVVRLSGTVETADDRAEAERLARSTKGVSDVRNDIELGDPTFAENVDDAWILTKIKAKLAADPEINPMNIDVDVVRGVVTLSGTVAKEKARSEAEELARSTRGVKSVKNLIDVRS